MHCLRNSSGSIIQDLGDWIGVESCVDLKSAAEMDGGEFSSCSGFQKSHDHGDQRLGKMEKQFPPALPWLAGTEHLPAQMPWVMRRYYTEDGRLVIKEEKVKTHEYFQVNRSDGRLTLNLIPVSDDELDDEDDIHDGGENTGSVESEVGMVEKDGFDGEKGDQSRISNNGIGSHMGNGA